LCRVLLEELLYVRGYFGYRTIMMITVGRAGRARGDEEVDMRDPTALTMLPGVWAVKVKEPLMRRRG